MQTHEAHNTLSLPHSRTRHPWLRWVSQGALALVGPACVTGEYDVEAASMRVADDGSDDAAVSNDDGRSVEVANTSSMAADDAAEVGDIEQPGGGGDGAQPVADDVANVTDADSEQSGGGTSASGTANTDDGTAGETGESGDGVPLATGATLGTI